MPDDDRPGWAFRSRAVPRLLQQQWGLNLPGELVRTELDTVALTLDACGGPSGNGLDEALLETLHAYGVPATLFLNARWIAEHPGATLELAADPLFELASHGARHMPLSVTGRSAYGIPGTANVGEAVEEITATEDWFREHTGAPARYMRPGTAYADDVAVRAARLLGRMIVGFSVNGDGGAQLSGDQVAQALATVRPGGIVIAHMNQPEGGTAEGFASAVPRLLDAGVSFGYLD